jgi:hypothetical protein
MEAYEAAIQPDGERSLSGRGKGIRCWLGRRGEQATVVVAASGGRERSSSAAGLPRPPAEFQRNKWSELREAWRRLEYSRAGLRGGPRRRR